MLFKDVLVDPNIKKQIINQVKSHRVGHAQLFQSKPGSHAFALAVEMAQYMNCEHPTDEDSCGQCPSCIQFEKLSHPDLHLYFPNSTTKSVKKDPDSQQFLREFRDFVFEHDYHIDIVDWLLELGGENKQASINIRDCSDIILHNSNRSYSGGFKVYILWCIDRFYHSATPKLLKTLEEPESQSLFILITEKPEQVLSTIRSRTQLVNIPMLTNKQITGALLQKFPDLGEQAARDIAVLAEGDYNKAIRIHEDDSSFKASLKAFDIILGGAMAFAQQQPPAAVQYDSVQEEIGEIIAQGRESQKDFITFSLRMFRNILMMSTSRPEMVKITTEEANVIEKFKGKLNLKQVSLISEEFNQALFHISRNGNSNIIFTDLFFKMAATLR